MEKNINPISADTIVGPSVKIQGDLNSEGNIQIEGEVTGKVKTTQNVQVGPTAKITAEISAGNAVIAGEIHGNMTISGSLILQSTAHVIGDISCTILRIEDGAIFKGKCNMSSNTHNQAGQELEMEE